MSSSSSNVNFPLLKCNYRHNVTHDMTKQVHCVWHDMTWQNGCSVFGIHWTMTRTDVNLYAAQKGGTKTCSWCFICAKDENALLILIIQYSPRKLSSHVPCKKHRHNNAPCKLLFSIENLKTLSGVRSPAMIFKIVDFPVPEGPMIPTASPYLICTNPTYGF